MNSGSGELEADISCAGVGKSEASALNVGECSRQPESSVAECKAEHTVIDSGRSSSRTLSPPVMIEDLMTGLDKTSAQKQDHSESVGSCVIWMPSRGSTDTGVVSGPSGNPNGVAQIVPQGVASSTPASLAETAQELTRREAWHKVRPPEQEPASHGCSSSSIAATTVPLVGHCGAYALQPQQPRQAGISRTPMYGQQRRWLSKTLLCQRQEEAVSSRRTKTTVLRMRSMPPLDTVSRSWTMPTSGHSRLLLQERNCSR